VPVIEIWEIVVNILCHIGASCISRS